MKGSDSSSRRYGWWPLLLVLMLASGVRIWTVVRSEVAARDSIGFIKYAIRYENEPFTKVLREAQQPPAYPVAILVTSQPVRLIAGDMTPQAMALSAQVASAIFGVLLVFPMVAFGSELLNRQFGWAAAAVFQCLPAWVRFTSDGLSESTFLFFTMMSLWAAARTFRTQSLIAMACCGTMAGLAYLTRPEGAEIVVAVGLVLVGMVAIGRWTKATAARAGVVLAAAFLVFFAPFVAITGRVTNKPTGRFLLGDPTVEQNYFGAAPRAALPLAVWYQDSGQAGKNRLMWAAQVFLTELSSSSRQIGLVFSIIGLAVWRKRIRNHPGGAVMAVLAIMHAALLIRMSSMMGYLSERHLALIVVTGCYTATLGLRETILRLMAVLGQPARWRRDVVLAGTLVVVFMTACPSLAKPMHANRAGHRAAGEWLWHHAPTTAGIRDPFCWAQYYSGRDFHETASPDPDEQFVVLELTDNQHSRLPLIPEAKAKAAAGLMVFHWPVQVPADKAQVAVFRWLRPRVPSANRPLPTSSGDGSDRIAAASP